MQKGSLEIAHFEFRNNFERIQFPHFLLFCHRARPKHFDNHMARILKNIISHLEKMNFSVFHLCEFRPVWQQELFLWSRRQHEPFDWAKFHQSWQHLAGLLRWLMIIVPLLLLHQLIFEFLMVRCKVFSEKNFEEKTLKWTSKKQFLMDHLWV